MLTEIFTIDMLCRDVLLHIGNAASLRKALRKCHSREIVEEIVANPPSEKTYGGRTIYKQDPYVMVLWLPKIPHTPTEYATMAHEIFHTAVAIMQSIGASLSVDSEEAYAYLIGFLTKKVLTIIDEQSTFSCGSGSGQGLVSAQSQP